MQGLATPQIRETHESQLPLISINQYKQTNNEHFAAWARKRVSIALIPMIGVAIIIGLLGTIRPSAKVGTILLSLQVALAFLSMYILWPRQHKSKR